MGRIIYSDGRTALTTTAFRYKLTDATGTLVKDWTTGATWTEEPAGTYYLDDEDAVPGTYYAVEPATGEVGGAGMVDWGEPAQAGDAMTLTAAYDAAKAAASQASVNAVDAKVDTVDGILDTTLPHALAGIADAVDGIAADYAKTGEASAAATGVGLSAGSLTDIYNQAVAALNAYDPPKRSEATADKNEILGVIATVDGIVDDILADTGTTLPAALTTIEGKVDTVDGILDTTLPLIQRVYRYFFNKRTHTNSAVTVYADDGVSVDASMTVTGDATTVTKDAPA